MFRGRTRPLGRRRSDKKVRVGSFVSGLPPLPCCRRQSVTIARGERAAVAGRGGRDLDVDADEVDAVADRAEFTVKAPGAVAAPRGLAPLGLIDVRGGVVDFGVITSADTVRRKLHPRYTRPVMPMSSRSFARTSCFLRFACWKSCLGSLSRRIPSGPAKKKRAGQRPLFSSRLKAALTRRRQPPARG